MSWWWCGTSGQRKPNRLLTLQNGYTANEQVVFSPCGAPDGKCDILICALKLVTN